eukprot:INCI7650.7.p1 GENE.INCI7650.7~~INCI7650.7.p1  ORF type:complete len:727 (-),score=120.98 INCI7650.7:1906-4086(-)
MAAEAAAAQSLHFYDLLSVSGAVGQRRQDDDGTRNSPAAAASAATAAAVEKDTVENDTVEKDTVAVAVGDHSQEHAGLLERILEFAIGSLVDFSRLSRVSRLLAVRLGSSDSAFALLHRHRVIGWFSGNSIEEVDSPIGSSESVSSSSSRSSDGFGFVPRRNRRPTRVRHRVASWVGDTDPRLLLAQFNFSVPFKQQVCSSAPVASTAVTEPSSASNAAQGSAKSRPVIEAAERMVALPTSKYRKGGPEMVVRAPSGQRCVRFDETARIPRVFWDAIEDEEPEPPLCHLRSQPLQEPLPQPLTIFCVAVTEDDSTLFSGHSARFELSHGAYTDAAHAAATAYQDEFGGSAHSQSDSTDSSITEKENGGQRDNGDRSAGPSLSPAAASAPATRRNAEGHTKVEAGISAPPSLPTVALLEGTVAPLPTVHTRARSKSRSDSTQSGSSNESESSSSSRSGAEESTTSTEEEVPPEYLLQGETMPGEWHVYTVVFNHNRSHLRVDGVAEAKANEPQSANHASKDDRPSVVAGADATTNTVAEKVVDNVAPSVDLAGAAFPDQMLQRVQRFGVGGGMLDGLSLGTDHIQDDSDEADKSPGIPGGPPSIEPRKRRNNGSTSSTSDSIGDLASSSGSDGNSSDSSDLGDFGSRGAMAEMVLIAGALALEDIELMERYCVCVYRHRCAAVDFGFAPTLPGVCELWRALGFLILCFADTYWRNTTFPLGHQNLGL